MSGLFGRFFPRAWFLGGTDEHIVSDCGEEDYVAGADAETAADFAGKSEAAAAEHCCNIFHGRFLDDLTRPVVSQ
jgi:hypothetical protein